MSDAPHPPDNEAGAQRLLPPEAAPPDTPPPTGGLSAAPDKPSRLAVAVPFVITALAAVALSLGAQLLLFPHQQPTAVVPTAQPTATAAPAATPAPSPTAPAAPVAPAVPTPVTVDGVLRLDILDLEEEDRQLWSALYLLRAASQLDDAVAALQINDLDEADRTMLTAYRSLDRAYAFSAEQEKGPIDTFRLSLSQIRDDLRLRPEGADRRLRQLRRLILSVVDEGG